MPQHNSELTVNASAEPINGRLVLNRSAAQPASGITVANARVSVEVVKIVSFAGAQRLGGSSRQGCTV